MRAIHNSVLSFFFSLQDVSNMSKIRYESNSQLLVVSTLYLTDVSNMSKIRYESNSQPAVRGVDLAF